MQFEDLKQLEQELAEMAGQLDEPVTALAQFDHAVVFARVEEGQTTWGRAASELSPSNLLDLRLFGPRGEWHMWRASGGDFSHRLRDDSHQNFFDELQVLWGTRARPVEERPGWSRVEEERGISYDIPLSLPSDIRGRHAPRLRVRHYARCQEETGLAGVFDSRLVSLEEA